MLNQNNILTSRSQQLFSIKLTYVNKSVINNLIKRSNIFGHVNPSQQTMADEIGCTRESVNTSIKKLRGKFFRDQYNHRRSSYYFLDPIFFNPEFREKYKHMFPQLAWKPKVTLLLSEELSNSYYKKTWQCEKLTPFIYKNYIYKKEATAKEQSVLIVRKLLHVKNNKDTQLMDKNINLLNKVCDLLKFNNEQFDKLQQFPDGIIKKAYERTQGKDLIAPFNYFYAVCLGEQKKNSLKGGNQNLEKKQSPRLNTINEKNNFDSTIVNQKNHFTNQNNDQRPIMYKLSDDAKNDKPPKWRNPIETKTYQQNLNDFALWYDEHADDYCQYYSWLPNVNKENIKKDFIEKLDRMFEDPEKVKRILERAEELRRQFTPQSLIDHLTNEKKII